MTRTIATALAALLLAGAAQAGEAGFAPRTTISELGTGGTQDATPSDAMLAQLDLARSRDTTRRAGPLKMPGRGFTPPLLDAPLSPTLTSLTK